MVLHYSGIQAVYQFHDGDIEFNTQPLFLTHYSNRSTTNLREVTTFSFTVLTCYSVKM